MLFCYLLTSFSPQPPLFFFLFRAILSPCLFCSFTSSHPYLFSCPSALFHQLIWLVCVSYLRVIISTAVATIVLNWAPIVQFKCAARDSHHPQEFILWMGKKIEANWVSQVLQQFRGRAWVSAEVSPPSPCISVIILPLLCVKAHNFFLAVLIICPYRQPGECWCFYADFMVLFTQSFVHRVEKPSRICIQKCYAVCAPKSYRLSAVYGEAELE